VDFSERIQVERVTEVYLQIGGAEGRQAIAARADRSAEQDVVELAAESYRQLGFPTIDAILARKPDQALMIGNDWDNDIVPAAALGMNTYWVAPPGATCRPVLTSSKISTMPCLLVSSRTASR